MNATPPVVTLQHLSRSPSPTSSLTSSSSFDPHSEVPPSPTGPERPTLGLRELTSMAIRDRKSRKAAKNHSLAPSISRGGSSSAPTTARSSLDVGHRPIEVRRGSDIELGFAREVIIKGWKIVGGSKWSDVGRVGAYVVYDIEITTLTGGTISILRRYTDFVRLRQALKARYPHMWQAIPPLPGKAHMAKFSEKFLADRQIRLQRFLKTIILHPEMGQGGTGSVVGQWVLDDGRRPSGS